MTTINYLSYIAAASEALSARKEEINRLNVFPVPDGDTGTNMSLTIESVVKEVSELPLDATFAEVRKAIMHGSLMGARGNSGVITSQILRGIGLGLEGATTFDAPTVATCMQKAVEVAFQAVRKPVEGTILTVLRDSADAAVQAADDGMDRDAALHFISEAAFASVKRTPELLPVLKENGVVDAGGFGFAILLEGFVGAVTGEGGQLPDAESFSHPEPKVAIEQINDWEGSAYRYCTEFLLNAVDLDKDETADFLSTMGDCELIVGEEPDYKVHVHTNTPGTVLTYMTDRGQVAEVHIHNMQLQSEDRDAKLAATSTEPPKPIGFVAVVAGSGMGIILESLGVDYIVEGGQTMNPSTADLLDACKKVNAEQVIILPNNKNIIMAAQAAADAADKPVVVVPTKSVPQGFSAMFAADTSASLEDNVAAMTEAAGEVITGEVTFAIKDAKAADGSSIKEGDVIGIVDDSIDVVGSSIDGVTFELVAKMLNDDIDTLTVLAGSDLADEDFAKLVGELEERYPDLEVEQHRGEQPLYPIVMYVE